MTSPETNTPSGPDAAFQNYLAQGEFRIQQCDGCARHIAAAWL